MGQPGTKVGELCIELGIPRQTLYRHVDPKGQLRPDGLSLLAQRSTPAAAGFLSDRDSTVPLRPAQKARR